MFEELAAEDEALETAESAAEVGLRIAAFASVHFLQ
jgi:hypothetical protein